MEESCCAVVVAAGESARMGLGVSKQLLLLRGIPVIAHTLRAFELTGPISRVVLVCRRQDIPEMERCVSAHSFRKVSAVVPGGETRQQSVRAGVLAAGDAAFLAIHDGARALVTPLEIRKVVEDAFAHGASALAVPVKDTLKVIGPDGMVRATPDRATLWAVQTPQVFRREEYLAALEAAGRAGADYTDDCQLIERVGGSVHLCQGSYSNMKITTQEDLLLAELLLKKREAVSL